MPRPARPTIVTVELAGDPVDGMPFGHQPASGSNELSSSSRTSGRPGGRTRVGLERAVRFERGDLRDPASVALLAGERCRDEPVDERRRLLERVLARADRDHVGVVVFTRELRGRDAPHQRRTHAAHLVRRDLLAVARAAEHHPERLDAGILVGDDGLRRTDAEGRVVIEWLVVERAVVDDIVPLPRQVVLQLGGELEAGVIGRDVDAHGSNPREPPSASGCAVIG